MRLTTRGEGGGGGAIVRMGLVCGKKGLHVVHARVLLMAAQLTHLYQRHLGSDR